MKKQLILAVLFSLNYFFALSQSQEIITIFNDEYDYNSKDWVNEYSSQVINYYDAAQKLSKTEYGYETNPKPGFNRQHTINTYKYDAKGRMIERFISLTTSATLQDSKRVNIVRWSYNEIDSLASYSQWGLDDSLRIEINYSQIRYLYDDQRRLSRKSYLSRDTQKNALKEYTLEIYTYDAQNRLTTIEYQNGNSIFINYTYDQRGYRIKEVYSGSYGINASIKTYLMIDNEYDNRGNKISAKRSQIDILTQKVTTIYTTTFEFDDQNRQIKRVNNSPYDDKRENINEFLSFYDKQGLVSKEIYRYYNVFVSPFRIDTTYFEEYNTEIKYYADKRKKESISNNFSKYFDAQMGKIDSSKSSYRQRFTYEINQNTAEDYFVQYIIYPNPTTQKITVDNTLENDCLDAVSLCDFTGRELVVFEKAPRVGSYPQCRWELEIPANISSGKYIIYLKAHNGVRVGKQILIQR